MSKRESKKADYYEFLKWKRFMNEMEPGCAPLSPGKKGKKRNGER